MINERYLSSGNNREGSISNVCKGNNILHKKTKTKNGYVINLHLLESCNYRCKHCFAHFGSEKMLSVRDWKQIIDNITEKTSVSRFNLAGGEPLLYKGLDELIEYINYKGILVSLITNGHLLSEDYIRKLRGKVSMVGLSIDALEPKLLREIGRCTKTLEILTLDRCVALCKTVNENDIQLKINTVVSKLNQHENFADFIQAVCPARWKILKMKKFSFSNSDNSELEITEEEFSRFCSFYNSIPHIAEVSLKNTYIMIDSGGRLVDNSNEAYKVIADLLREDFFAGFNTMYFDSALYNVRYK
jgi:radical S-adenosyl methionine domain-containing protein 2